MGKKAYPTSREKYLEKRIFVIITEDISFYCAEINLLRLVSVSVAIGTIRLN